MRKIKFYSEAAYVLGVVMLSGYIAMLPAADFGLSMLAVPAYLISLKTEFITFGQADYIVEGALFALFFILMKRIKPLVLTSLITSILFGAMLDLWRAIIPILNPAITEPGSMGMPGRLALYIGAALMGAFSITLMFRTYLYPQIFELFVKGVSEKYGLDRTKFKVVYDASFLTLSIVMGLLMFGRIIGVGIGTFILVFSNGFFIGKFEKLFDRWVDFVPAFPKLAEIFKLQ